MNQKLSGFSITIIGLILAALGVISPIAWDWYSKKSELSLYQSEMISLVEKKETVDGLKITYKGHDVDSLGKTIFKLENTGRTPIEESDLISPPTIKILGGKILHASIESLKPKNIEASISLLDEGRLSITFPLLNSGDVISVGVLSSGNDIRYIADARIKNVYQLLIIDEKSKIRFRTSFGASVYIVGFFTLLFVFVFFSLLGEVPKKRKAFRDIKSNNTPIKENATYVSVCNYIENDLNFLIRKKRDELRVMANESGNTLNNSVAQKILNRLFDDVGSYNPLGGAVMTLILISIGIYYIYNNIFI